MNFNIPYYGKYLFFQYSTPLVGMRFCRHVLNSSRNKNKMLHNPYLLGKVFFLASKTLLSPIGTLKKNFFINFKLYGLANDKE
jgi:hypothetical protein